MNVTRINQLDATARLKAYAGKVLVMKQVPAALDLCVLLKELTPRFDCDAQETSFEDIKQACTTFEESEDVKRLFRKIFEYSSVDGKTTCWDRPRLRIQQSGGGIDDIESSSRFGKGKFSSTLPPHRDTWASNILQQLNWWIPLDEIDEGRTMCFYPEYFLKAVPNTSHKWNFDELRSRRRQGLPYPQLPELDTTFLDNLKEKGKPLVVDPGDVVVFSGAHLHASVINKTGKTRYSCEIRSVDADDYRNGKAAPNVDGKAPCVPLHWFQCIDDAEKSLADVI